MGRVFKRKGSKRWYIEYKDADGRAVRSSAFTDKRASQHLLREIEVRERRKAEGLIPRTDNRRAITEVVEAFREHARARLRPRTRQRYFDGINRILDFLDVREIAEVTPDRVEAFLSQRVQEVATRTANVELAGFRRMLNWAAEVGLIASNPIARVKPLPVRRVKVRRALDDSEVQALLDASPEPFRTIWWTFLSTGLRHRELVELRWPDIDLDEGTLCVRPEVDKAKRGRHVTVPFELVERLRKMHQSRADSEFVFVNGIGRPWRNNLLRSFYQCLRRAGIPVDGSVDLHALRYTYVTALLRAGVNIKVVQELAGHSTLEMTLRVYAQVFRMDRRAAVERLPWCKETDLKAADAA